MHGLISSQVKVIFEKYGSNELIKKKPTPVIFKFLKEFRSPLIFILFIVAGVTFFMGEFADTVLILFVSVFNAVIGFVQEMKAENTVAALKSLIRSSAKVIREGKLMSIQTVEVVPGDIVELEAGDIVPADGIVLESKNLQIVESQLTGESTYIDKIAINQGLYDEILKVYVKREIESDPEQIIKFIEGYKNRIDTFEKENILYQTTSVINGKAKLLVLKTGMDTRVGHISKVVIEQVKNPAPIEEKIHHLTKLIILIAAVSCISVFSLGIIKNFEILEIFKLSVSLAISAIPEGLPIVLTLTLAIGAWKMGKAKAILKNLTSVSTLAGTKVVCTDKTGTLTKGRLELEGIVSLEEISSGKAKNQYGKKHNFDILLQSTLCNDAQVAGNGRIIGDALDAALLEHAKNNQVDFEEFRKGNNRLDELPFDSVKKFMATLHQSGKIKTLVVKGAPEVVIDKCKFDKPSEKRKILDYIEEQNQKGFRTILIANKVVKKDQIIKEELVDLDFLAVLEFVDPIRRESRDAILRCKESGINVVMITGDHLSTAMYVAKKIGIYDSEEDISIIGEKIDAMKKSELIKILPKLKVIGRANPETKLKLVDAFQSKGMIVAMTGDGINDAPALTSADIGIAMGVSGTDVAKESSDMVLTDDNFATIVKGVEEARVVFENLKKVIIYLFSTSLAEIVIMLTSIYLGLGVPITAVQIIWLNLVTDGFLDVAIATEGKENDIMKNKSTRYTGNLLSRFNLFRIFYLGTFISIGTLIPFIYFYNSIPHEILHTFILVILTAFQWFNAMNARSENKSIFEIGVFKNRSLLVALFIVVTLQVLGIYTSFFQNFLETSTIPFDLFLVGILIGSSILVFEELRKLVMKALF